MNKTDKAVNPIGARYVEGLKAVTGERNAARVYQNMSRRTFINSTDDMRWLNDNHLCLMNFTGKAAMLYGNEDCPEQIDVYDTQEPLISDQPRAYFLNYVNLSYSPLS